MAIKENEFAKVVAEAFDEKINVYKNLIKQLERAKEEALKIPSLPPMTLHVSEKIKSHKSKKSRGKKSKKDRIVEAIENTTGKFKSIDILEQVNNNGHGAIQKVTFYSTFSRLKDEGKLFKQSDEKGFYERIIKG